MDAPGKRRPADDTWKAVKVSTAWVEGEKVFAFYQRINPGPSELISLGMSKGELKKKVDEILAIRAAVAEAIRSHDPARMAGEVKTWLRIESAYVHGGVITALAAAGPDSLMALRKIVGDESLMSDHGDAMQVMAKVGGAAMGQELTEVVKQELAFWKRVAPTLQLGWWNGGGGIDWDEVDRLRDHYTRAHSALIALRSIGDTDSREAVIALRDYWRSLPQLREIGLDQMGTACDELLAVRP